MKIRWKILKQMKKVEVDFKIALILGLILYVIICIVAFLYCQIGFFNFSINEIMTCGSMTFWIFVLFFESKWGLHCKKLKSLNNKFEPGRKEKSIFGIFFSKGRDLTMFWKCKKFLCPMKTRHVLEVGVACWSPSWISYI